MKINLNFLARLVLTIAVVGLIIWQLGGLQEVGRWMAGMKPVHILLVMLVMTADRALMTYKWTLLLRSRKVYLPFLLGLQIYCASMIWGLFLPTTMGSDAIRAFSASRKGLSGNEVVASILIERMIGFLSALLLGLLSLILLNASGTMDERFRYIWLIASAILMSALLVFAVSFSKKAYHLVHGRLLSRFQNQSLFRKFRLFHETYLNYQDNTRSLFSFFGLTFVEQLLPILITWLIALGIGLEINLVFIAGAVPLSILIARIPISIDGLGVYDGMLALLMSMGGATPAQAVAITLIQRILQTLVWLPWWGAYVIGNGSLRPPDPAAG